jgi:hypothetical protein
MLQDTVSVHWCLQIGAIRHLHRILLRHKFYDVISKSSPLSCNEYLELEYSIEPSNLESWNIQRKILLGVSTNAFECKSFPGQVYMAWQTGNWTIPTVQIEYRTPAIVNQDENTAHLHKQSASNQWAINCNRTQERSAILHTPSHSVDSLYTVRLKPHQAIQLTQSTA